MVSLLKVVLLGVSVSLSRAAWAGTLGGSAHAAAAVPDVQPSKPAKTRKVGPVEEGQAGLDAAFGHE
jgi:hypothetical protein